MKRLVLTVYIITNFFLTQAQPYPLDLYSAGQELFISTSTRDGNQLWKKDGQCIFLVKDFPLSERSDFIEWNGILYFLNNDVENYRGKELWRSDGTPEGTNIVKDINKVSSNDSYPRYLTVVNNILFFTAYDGSVRGLWRTDGTDNGTVMIKDQSTWSSSLGGITELTEVNGKLFFSFATTNQTELWTSDGTDLGTVKIKVFPGGAGKIRHLTNGNGVLYFSANESQTGYELWKSDGTTSGTVMIKDIYPGSGNGLPDELIFIDNTLYFAATDPDNGRELWKSDGTSQGTIIYKDIVSGTGSSNPINLNTAFGDLFFVTWKNGDSEADLWKIDLTNHNAVKLYDFTSDPVTSTRENNVPIDFTQVNDKLFFVANDGLTGNELWVTDGTAGGTKQVLDSDPGPSDGSVYHLTKSNDKLFFTATGTTDPYYYSLWQTDDLLNTEELTIAQTQACQTINFPPISDKTLGDASFTLTATSSSGLQVSLSSTSDKITLNGTSVTLLKSGSVTITAAQDGNANFYPAEPMSRTFCINPATPIISLINDAGIKLKSNSEVGNEWYLNGLPINETGSTLTPILEGDYSVKVSIDGCPSLLSNTINTSVLAVEENVHGYTFYPNPVNDFMFVKGNIQMIGMYNSIGNEIPILASKSDDDIIQLNFNSLATGQYILRYLENNIIRSVRFTKK